MITSWKTVWEGAIAPQISTEGMKALKRALETDDPRLIQGATTSPPSLSCVQDWQCEAACALGYCGWKDGDTVADVEEFFARCCFEADMAFGEPAACRYFLNWYDETPREEMRRELLAVVVKELWRRDCENAFEAVAS